MDVQILDSVTVSNKMDNNSVIILSDDETENKFLPIRVILSDNEFKSLHGAWQACGACKEMIQILLVLASQKQELDTTKDRQISASHPKPKSVDSRRKEINSKFKVKDSFPSQFKAIKEPVRDVADDPWELAVKSLKPHQSCLTKPSASIPKRQVISTSITWRKIDSGYLRKLDAGVKRFKPPKLDDWYRPILEIDYFVTVGASVLSVERIDDFHLVRCVHDGSDSAAYRTFSENDLVLLTRQPLQNSSHEVHMVGKETEIEFDKLLGGQMGIGGVFRNLGGNMVRAFPKQTGLSLVTDRGAPRFIGGIDKSNLAGF
ncbi:hypothetical protein CK203_023065 [Vitis vinifera]|uniref:Helicase SEN1 beta-barrel domain-containing protein n=1 Tax=Vitis vinifera TaxID=29760 RepID=A0A438J400_VITVI|nr:hypothetical protein CK203_023065 [Vitis vinifera]